MINRMAEITDKKKVVAIVSGGLDSVCLAHCLKSLGNELLILSFDYGQRHNKELQYAKRCSERLDVPFLLVDISKVCEVLPGSALTDNGVDVPDGHYEDETMKATIVPNRNAIFLSIAFGIAAAHGYDAVATAVHSGDHHIYPDCRPEFINTFQKMQKESLDGVASIALLAPFVDIGKHDIVYNAWLLDDDIPFEETWSCYKGGEFHCGVCGTCVERKEAFELVGVKDLTTYEE